MPDKPQMVSPEMTAKIKAIFKDPGVRKKEGRIKLGKVKRVSEMTRRARSFTNE